MDEQARMEQMRLAQTRVASLSLAVDLLKGKNKEFDVMDIPIIISYAHNFNQFLVLGVEPFELTTAPAETEEIIPAPEVIEVDFEKGKKVDETPTEED